MRDSHVHEQTGKQIDVFFSAHLNDYDIRIFLSESDSMSLIFGGHHAINCDVWMKNYLRTFRFRWNTTSGNSKSDNDFESSDNCSNWNDSALLLCRFCIICLYTAFVYTYL